MNRYEHARAVLESLGKRVARPQPPRVGVRDVLCQLCKVQIRLARLTNGNWAPLDIHPTGELVIANNVVIDRGDIHGDAARYCFHRCERKRA